MLQEKKTLEIHDEIELLKHKFIFATMRILQYFEKEKT